MRHLRFLSRPAILVTLCLACFGCVAQSDPADSPEKVDFVEAPGIELTVLDQYVRTPDPNYGYTLVKTIPGDGYTTYVLDMVSQAWLTEQEVDRHLWQHWLVIVRPDDVGSKKGLLIIGAGDNGGDPPDEPDGFSVQLAMATQTVVGHLYMVPNQPLTFADDQEQPRWEDAIIAYTWDKYFRTDDDKWPLRLPMTKAAVRAMDTITSFMDSEEGGGVSVEEYVVAGASKRGWTTWTTAAVDGRVIAIIPIVIDMLNVEPSFKHHFEVYGKYAEAVGDYEAMGIMEWQWTPEYRRLMEIVEPYEYRARLTLPKYIVNATGDQFFLPDSWQFYFDELPGEKYLRYVPNADHGLGGSDAGESIIAWYHSIVHNVPMPRFTWHVEEDGTIRVLALDEPTEVRLWQATNLDARNFQKQTIGDAWTSSALEKEETGVYTGQVPNPSQGWTAFFIELTYPSGISVPFKFTTGVKVVPDTKLFTFEYATDEDRETAPIQP